MGPRLFLYLCRIKTMSIEVRVKLVYACLVNLVIKLKHQSVYVNLPRGQAFAKARHLKKIPIN